MHAWSDNQFNKGRVYRVTFRMIHTLVTFNFTFFRERGESHVNGFELDHFADASITSRLVTPRTPTGKTKMVAGLLPDDDIDADYTIFFVKLLRAVQLVLEFGGSDDSGEDLVDFLRAKVSEGHALSLVMSCFGACVRSNTAQLHGRVNDVVKLGKTHALSQSHFNHYNALLGGETLNVLPTKDRVATYFEARVNELAKVAAMRNLTQTKALLSSGSIASVGWDSLDGVGGLKGDEVIGMSMTDFLCGSNMIKGIRGSIYEENDTTTPYGRDFKEKALSRAKLVGTKRSCFKCITKFWNCDGQDPRYYHYCHDDPSAFEHRIDSFNAYDMGLCLAFGGLLEPLETSPSLPEGLKNGYEPAVVTASDVVSAVVESLQKYCRAQKIQIKAVFAGSGGEKNKLDGTLVKKRPSSRSAKGSASTKAGGGTWS